MDRSFIEKIEEMADPHIIERNGVEYSDKELSPIISPKVRTMEFNTLRGMVEMIHNEHEKFISPIIVNVRSHKTVEAYTSFNEYERDREQPYVSNAELIQIRFDQWLDYESMMIMLKSRFVETNALLDVIQLLGTITDEQTAQAMDDGFTQTVVVKKGVAMKGSKVVKPIVKLRPYRTFNEVDQPESNFLLRLNGNGGVALFEADGGAWKLQARTNIAEYLRKELDAEISCGSVIITE